MAWSPISSPRPILALLSGERVELVARMGIRIVPPIPAFYNNPASVDDIVDHIAGRVLDQFGLPAPRVRRWSGPPSPESEG
jgi:4-hydroxy-3-polyprenylbenzoate decarboxylase